jgi:uncharacterized YccA/Bax inhibitor family protein
MSILQSRNPAMKVLQSERAFGADETKVMTLGGTINATCILLAIVATVGILVWQKLNSVWIATGTFPGWLWPMMLAGAFGSVVVGFIIYGKPTSARFISPIHAVLEGMFVGGASFYFPMVYGPMEQGEIMNPSTVIVAQAALATVMVTATMLLGYATGVLRVGEKMQKFILLAGAALGGYVMILYLMQFIGFGGLWNGFTDNGPIGIGFSVLVIGLVSLFLLLDFKYIEEGINNRAPKYMEWVGAWGLMVTLVYLYIEILRLLAKLRSND